MRGTLAATGCAVLMTLAACTEPTTTPGDPGSNPGQGFGAGENAQGWQDVGSVVRWNRKSFVLHRARTPLSNFGRINSYLALAQYRAVLAVKAEPRLLPARQAGAAAGASVVVLRQFYPLDGAAIDAELAAQRAVYYTRPHWGEAFDAGDAIGRGIGLEALAEAATDNLGVAPLPPQPVGPGFWVSSGAPVVKGGYGQRPFFLTSGDEINAPPPPAFGSPEYVAGLADVRALSDARTPEQVAIVTKWVPFSGPLFSEVAADLAERYSRSELEAARIFAYANVAASDAIVGCFHTKFIHWFIRPTQADPGITLATGLPNHPSYPSAHSCQAGAWEEILADAFPADRSALRAMAEEASFSRVLGGLHYRFDGDAGLELGRRAARLALERGIE